MHPTHIGGGGPGSGAAVTPGIEVRQLEAVWPKLLRASLGLVGLLNALSLVGRHPGARQNRGGTQRPKRSNPPLDAGRSLLGVDSPAEMRLSWSHLRVSPCRRATSIGPENPRAQQIPVALLCEPPER